MKDLMIEIQKSSLIIARFLSSNFYEGKFCNRYFYGDIFSVLLWSHFSEFQDNINAVLRKFFRKKPNTSKFHWEFINYGLVKYSLNYHDDRVINFLKNPKFRNNRTINWRILKIIVKTYLNNGKTSLRDTYRMKSILSKRINGLFYDSNYDRSFQYHCFSTALLGELALITENEKYIQSFLESTDYFLDFILPNGDALYIGRGQEQIFGYGTLIFNLILAYRITNKKKFLNAAKRVWKFLISYRTTEGVYPLMLNKDFLEPNIFTNRDMELNLLDKEYLGWYYYNNYSDYLPFLGYYLCFSVSIMKKKNLMLNNHRYLYHKLKEESEDFLIETRDNYKAIISRPNGVWSNSMPVPYICYADKSCIPYYGGEQYFKTPCTKSEIPLPYGELANGNYLYFVDFKYKINGNTLLGRGNKIVFKRFFNFFSNEIFIEDETEFKHQIDFRHLYITNYIFYKALRKNEQTEFEIFHDPSLIFAPLEKSPIKLMSETVFTPSGEGKRIFETISNLHIEKGDILTRKYRIYWRKEIDVKLDS